jgi:UDP-N-acetylmuramoylalanine--D-glutamate ligase
MNLTDKTVLVLGLGESGLAIARWCVREGARCRVADSRSEPPALALLQNDFPDVPVHTGGFPEDLLLGIDLIAVSPGLAPGGEPQHALLNAARLRELPIWGELDFFAAKLAALKAERGYAPHVIAITGTNGKTTVTRLVGRLCGRAGRPARVAGNISPAALDALRMALNGDGSGTTLPEVWVLELSSFQLAYATRPIADAAAILNITQDHLDWHGSIEAYASAKERILAPATRAVLNRADRRVMAMAGRTALPVITFGLDAPVEPESFGVVFDGSTRWLAYAEPREPEEPTRRGKKGAALEVHIKRLMPLDALRIRGDHNAANALAALGLCHAIGLPLAPLLHALRDYRGEPHRVETIAVRDNVEYIDDSKGTNVGATAAALDGLGRRIVLIAGGEGKGQDFSPLAAPIARHARAVILIGKDAPVLRAAIAETALAAGVRIEDADSLEAAVARSHALARPGDAVLLSPACASLDMFRNYRHRAEVFAQAVAHLVPAAQRSPEGGEPAGLGPEPGADLKAGVSAAC